MEWAAAMTAGVTALCSLWWVTECLPIYVTGIVPFVAFPALGVIDHNEIAHAYGHSLILLLMAGLLLSSAMEKCNAHRRLALSLVRMVGGQGGRRLVLGFMLASALLSMWISNTATTLMLLPIAMAVLEQSDDGDLRMPLLLGIAFAASIGGMATPVGTPPNVLFMSQYAKATGEEYSFAGWMAIGLPVTIVLLPICWLWLTRGLSKGKPLELPKVGRFRRSEILTLGVFVLTAVLWVTRKNPAGGWTTWLGMVDENGVAMVGDSTVALFSVVLLFVLPSGEPTQAGDSFADTRLLDWKTASRVPWGILLLFGGGLAISAAFDASGLSMVIGSQLEQFTALPTFWLILCICISVTFLTELTSSTATTALLLPVLAGVAAKAELSPAVLLVPATISASCAFMLPVATAPNTIIYSAGGIHLGRMARDGLFLNLIAAFVVSVLCYWQLG
jgi:sodium-dependent dicarboxylate transporter 2/3/5